MNQKDFNTRIKEYGKLIELRDENDRSNNKTRPCKIILYYPEKLCEFKCGEIVKNQSVDYNLQNKTTRCNICKKYKTDDGMMSYNDMIKETRERKCRDYSAIRGPNTNVRKDSILQEKGISYNKKMKAYIVNVWNPFKKKKIYHGFYKTLEQAIIARNNAEKNIGKQ